MSNFGDAVEDSEFGDREFLGDAGVSVRAGEDKGMDGGPVLASFVPFKEGSEYGIRVEGTDVFRTNPQAYRSLACQGFQSCLGSFLATEGPNKYTGALKILPARPEDAQLASDVVSYSQGRVKALQEVFGDKLLGLEGGWSKGKKTAVTILGVGFAAAGAVLLGIYAPQLATSMKTITENWSGFQALPYIQGMDPMTAQTVINSVTVGSNAARDAITQGVYTAVGGAGLYAGGREFVNLAVESKGGKAKIKVSDKDRAIGLYLKDGGQYQVVPVAPAQSLEIPATV